MKPIRFLGNSLECLREFPIDARQHVGFQLDRVQRGEQAHDFKAMPAVGKEATSKRDIELARARFAVLTRDDR